MNRFAYLSAASLQKAIDSLDGDWSTALIAGGTDLLHEMKRGLRNPDRVVSIASIAELSGVRETADSVRIGATTSPATLETDPIIRRHLPVLCLAAAEVASPQLRTMGTIAGNILQRPRCWYYRDPDIHCLRKGGDRCHAVAGDNRYHAILGGGPCHIVCPSDLAPALVALQARATIASADSKGGLRSREIPLVELFRGPKEDPRRENCLGPGEVITEICLAKPEGETRGTFLKARSRGVWDFALASVAAVVSLGGNGEVSAASIALGGVAPNPWLAQEAAEGLRDSPLTEEACARAARLAVAGARPLKDNRYKVDLTQNLVRRALSSLADGG